MSEEIIYIIIGVIALVCILLVIFVPLIAWIIRRTRLEKHIQQRFEIRDRYQKKSKSLENNHHFSTPQKSIKNLTQSKQTSRLPVLQPLQSSAEPSSDLSTLLKKSHTLQPNISSPLQLQQQSQVQTQTQPRLQGQLQTQVQTQPQVLKSAPLLQHGVSAPLSALHFNAPSSPINISDLHSNPQEVSYAFIINPSKPRTQEIGRRIRQFFKNHHLKTPLFIYTTLEKDGAVCAREALEQGVHIVVACGGDGTIRTVAEAMAHSGRIMGVLPSGTANLFCRNIGIPLNNVELALQIIISPGSRHVDMGWITLDSPTNVTSSPSVSSAVSFPSASQSLSSYSHLQSPPSPASVSATSAPDPPFAKKTHGFLLIAGAGFDATMIKAADPNLKKAMGWVAYFVGGLNHLYDRKFSGKVSVRYKGDKELSAPSEVTFRSFLIGNCGKIPLFSLIPNADISDGFLDFELLDTNHGIVGWVYLAGDVVHQTIANKAQHGSFSSQEARIIHSQGTEATMELEQPIPVQADGDLLGSSSSIRVFVDPGALIIRAPLSQDQTDATGLLNPIRT